MANRIEEAVISLLTEVPETTGIRTEEGGISLVSEVPDITGVRTEEAVISLLSENAIPTTCFYGTPVSGNEPLSVQFYDKSYGGRDPTSWLWDFGDGETSTDQNPLHEYNDDGTFTVVLTATNAYGSSSKTETDYIIVASITPRYEIVKTLTGTLPDRVWILPIVNDLDNIRIKAGSGTTSDPAVTETRLVTITGQYLKIRIYFDETDTLRKILIFKIFD